MSIRLDRVAFSTLHEAPRNYDTKTGDINISGTVGAGATQNFSTIMTYERGGTRADVYLDGNSVKTLANTGSRASEEVYQRATPDETFSVLVEYSTSSITVTVSIQNGTGSPITLTTQTITASAVLYDMPISDL